MNAVHHSMNHNEELTCLVSFFQDKHIVEHTRDDIPDLDLAFLKELLQSESVSC